MIDKNDYILPILLHLSKAYDTIDHDQLLAHLSKQLGMSMDWFGSYLTDRTQAVLIDGVESDLVRLLCDIHRGTVLGPLPFIIYTSSLSKILCELE